MSVLSLTDPLVPVTWSTKLPVDPVEVVVKLTGELPVPPGGGVTVCGIVTPIPVGLFPTQEVENVTGELNPPTELTITFVDPLRPGMTETVAELGAMLKSGAAAATGAKTDGVPAIAMLISVVCETVPPVAVTARV